MHTPVYPVFFLNDELVAADQARISPLDRGFLFADSVYEVMLVRNGRVCNLDKHLHRLQSSLQGLEIPAMKPPAEWLAGINRLIAANDAPDAALYLQISRGIGPSRSLLWDEPLQPTVFMFLDRLPHEQQYGVGLRAATAEDLRWHKCDIKATGLTANMVMRRGATSADEVIMHRSGAVTEGTSSNVFAVLDGQIVTPPLNASLILPGVTRSLVLEALSEMQMPCEERTLHLNELQQAEEIWISSTLRGVAPIVSLDNTSVGQGTPGPLWKQLQDPMQHKRNRAGHAETA